MNLNQNDIEWVKSEVFVRSERETCDLVLEISEALRKANVLAPTSTHMSCIHWYGKGRLVTEWVGGRVRLSWELPSCFEVKKFEDKNEAIAYVAETVGTYTTQCSATRQET